MVTLRWAEKLFHGTQEVIPGVLILMGGQDFEGVEGNVRGGDSKETQPLLSCDDILTPRLV